MQLLKFSRGLSTKSIHISSGFSLVEAIVALVILSLIFTAVWGWFGTAITSTARIEQALSLPEVYSQSMVSIELESLEERRSGEIQVGKYLVNWQATPDRSSKDESYRRQPAWIITLFTVQAEIIHQGKPVSSFSTKVIRQWRDPNYIDFNEPQ